MAILLTCPTCNKTVEYPEGTKVKIMQTECSFCGDDLIASAIACWLRGINPSLIGD